MRTSQKKAKPAQALGLVVETVDIPARISYLRKLKENTVFAEDAQLNNIIADYDRTMCLRNLAERHKEMAA